MKKVFFTAIAMIAFSSASMANTIADEEVVVVKQKCETIAAIAVSLAEEEYHNEMANQGIDACWDSYTYNYIYELHLNDCLNP